MGKTCALLSLGSNLALVIFLNVNILLVAEIGFEVAKCFINLYMQEMIFFFNFLWK